MISYIALIASCVLSLLHMPLPLETEITEGRNGPFDLCLLVIHPNKTIVNFENPTKFPKRIS